MASCVLGIVLLQSLLVLPIVNAIADEALFAADDQCEAGNSSCALNAMQLLGRRKLSPDCIKGCCLDNETYPSKWQVPPTAPAQDAGAYGQLPSTALEDHLKKSGAAKVDFWPKDKSRNFTEMDNAFGKLKGIETLWGDCGPQSQPGFGGVRSFDVVTITPPESGLLIYHMAPEPTKANKCDGCDIWWGFLTTYDTDFFNASVNVQTCWNLTHVTRCNMTERFDAIVGMGWPADLRSAKERECDNDTSIMFRHDPKFPAPPDDFRGLQVIQNMCQQKSAQCSVCPMNQGSGDTVAGSFETCDEPIEVQTPCPPDSTLLTATPQTYVEMLMQSHR